MREARWLGRGGNAPRRISFGADYNPDQWPREYWTEDVRLMRLAQVDIVSVGIFSWAQLQPSMNEWNFGWLDDVLDLLHANGIAVDLATATASPPPWLTTAYPEILPVTERGETLYPGARQHWRPTSPVFREFALGLVEQLAQRYATHPALAAWHVNNELGCHNAWDHSADATAAFRSWLRVRYCDIATLNEAWGTAFWSQRYSTFDEILTPRLAAAHPNPSQQLDFKRFSSDALKQHLRAERDVLRRWTPDIPVTTNFMVFDDIKAMNFADWAPEVDFISNDHYVSTKPTSRDELSFSANLTGNLAQGAPWFLMEHSTSAVNWQPVNVAKSRGELAADALSHVAHGADAVCYFQWRQSRAGAEKFHSAMLPHAGEHSDVFHDVVELGKTLTSLTGVAGTRRKPARIAILFDWESWWASEQDSHHTDRFRYRDEVLDWYRAVLDAGLRADVRPAGSTFEGYSVVVAPALHVLPAPLAERLDAFVRGGGHLLVTYNSGIVDENDHVWLDGYPGPLRELTGIRVQEIRPLLEGESTVLSNGARSRVWTERVDVIDPSVEIVASYADGDLAGRAAITTLATGAGSASYVSSDLDEGGRAQQISRVAEGALLESELPEALRGEVELMIRTDGSSDTVFLRNRSPRPVDISSFGSAHTVVGEHVDGSNLVLPSPGVAVVDLVVSRVERRSTALAGTRD
ncbi:beta-galactosidase [Agromyces albus]|uniref:Beta-galactosidase n=1 Tax=Agromyces albus TaxID=205332 RepID=A0A4Q2KZF9_9MICO|nr:beta-galactosidase [Agromyces albus]RXZ69403.1 beta-galactosidase [Agromyces albus]